MKKCVVTIWGKEYEAEIIKQLDNGEYVVNVGGQEFTTANIQIIKTTKHEVVVEDLREQDKDYINFCNEDAETFAESIWYSMPEDLTEEEEQEYYKEAADAYVKPTYEEYQEHLAEMARQEAEEERRSFENRETITEVRDNGECFVRYGAFDITFTTSKEAPELRVELYGEEIESKPRYMGAVARTTDRNRLYIVWLDTEGLPSILIETIETVGMMRGPREFVWRNKWYLFDGKLKRG